MSDNSRTNPNEAPKAENEELKPAEQEKVSGGACDFFVDLGGIKGEATTQGHEGWIEILSYK